MESRHTRHAIQSRKTLVSHLQSIGDIPIMSVKKKTHHMYVLLNQRQKPAHHVMHQKRSVARKEPESLQAKRPSQMPLVAYRLFKSPFRG